jgi:hypothetical protein
MLRRAGGPFAIQSSVGKYYEAFIESSDLSCSVPFGHYRCVWRCREGLLREGCPRIASRNFVTECLMNDVTGGSQSWCA